MFAYQRLKYVCVCLKKKKKLNSSKRTIDKMRMYDKIHTLLKDKYSLFSLSLFPIRVSMYFKNIFWTNIMGRKCKLTRKRERIQLLYINDSSSLFSVSKKKRESRTKIWTGDNMPCRSG